MGTPIEDALMETVSEGGGDTDTNAAISGMLLALRRDGWPYRSAGAWQCWHVARSLGVPTGRGLHATGQTM